MSKVDTIVAAATPPGRGGVGIVRRVGTRSPEIAAVILGSYHRRGAQPSLAFSMPHKTPSTRDSQFFFPRRIPTPVSTYSSCKGHGGTMVMERSLPESLKSAADVHNPVNLPNELFLNDNSTWRKQKP